MKKDKKYMLMLGMFSKNTPEYAKKRADELSEVEARCQEGEKYIEVVAGPFTQAQAEENLAKLALKNMQGYIYSSETKQEAPEEPESVSEGE